MSSPAAPTWSWDRLGVFAKGHQCWTPHRWWDDRTWSEWQDLATLDTLAAVSRKPGNIATVRPWSRQPLYQRTYIANSNELDSGTGWRALALREVD